MPHSTQLGKEQIAISTPESEAGVLVVRNRCRRRQPIPRESALEALGMWSAHLVSIITAGKKSKEIRPGVDPAASATLIRASLEGALVVAVNCRVQRRSSIIDLRPSDIAVAILKLAVFSRLAEIFTQPLAVL